jgi:hypothetical protein
MFMMRPIGVALTATLVSFGIGLAPPAGAENSAAFVDFLASNGENVSTPELSYAAIDYGRQICDVLTANQSVSQTLDFMVNRQPRPQSFESARKWLIGSVSYLCPDQLHTRN